MRVRQLLDIQAARSIADEDPLPGRAFASSSGDQLLIDEPGFNRPKVTQPWPGNTSYFRSNFKLATRNLRPMIKIYRLLQQM